MEATTPVSVASWISLILSQTPADVLWWIIHYSSPWISPTRQPDIGLSSARGEPSFPIFELWAFWVLYSIMKIVRWRLWRVWEAPTVAVSHLWHHHVGKHLGLVFCRMMEQSNDFKEVKPTGPAVHSIQFTPFGHFRPVIEELVWSWERPTNTCWR